jgi:hypothetical protein
MKADVEDLLRRERRAALPLWRQCLLYLDPFALFKDASRGPLRAREQALLYNRAMRWMLLAYLRRWAAIAVGLLAAIPAAAAAVGACVALTVLAVIVAVYVLLGAPD